ncbi:hypothetical protein CsSME_00042660 [Camellia sinensis var. sinensis]
MTSRPMGQPTPPAHFPIIHSLSTYTHTHTHIYLYIFVPIHNRQLFVAARTQQRTFISNNNAIDSRLCSLRFIQGTWFDLDFMSMYSSRGGQQQPYASQSAAYAQNLMPAYAGSSVGGPDGTSQLSMASRHSSMLGGPQESDITGYRGHPSAGAHYGGQYSSVYGSAALSSGQQVSGMSAKGAGPSALEGRSGYGSAMPDSPKLPTGDFVSSSSHGYGHKRRDLQNVPTGRFGDSMSFAHQHQTDMYDRMDQASLLRQEQLLKAQSLQSASLDGGSRQADYLAARGASIRHPAQDHMSFGGRMDADPRSLSILSGSSYGGQHTPSILGAAPQRNVDDLIYAQSSSNPGYGVSLPPGRDYATGKGLHGASLDADYPGSLLARSGHSRIDERNDDRGVYARELERREEERRREHLRDREKDREREKERERERRRERERERENILARREKERDRERERGAEIRRERGAEIRRERTPPRISKSKDRSERRGSSLTKDAKPARRDPPRTEALHRRHSPVKEKRREYDCKVYSSSLVDVKRDYLSLDKRYPRLFISPECSKVVVNWPRESLRLSIHTPVSFEHDFVEEDTGADQKERPAIPSADEPVKSERGTTVWNAKMILMSGLSQNALDELSSENSYDDRIPHFCNMLRFAVLKKEHSLMAIGGPWDIVDGGDPSVDDSSLVRTVVRHAKDVTQLDLKNCRHWNRFLEIHYDKVGNDGLFSHKEVTVLYVPDLSDCLPSLEAWRDQWLAHKKAVAERESRLAFKKESREKLEGPKGKETDSSKEVKGDDKSEKKVESAIPGQVVDVIKKQKGDHKLKGNSADKAEVGNEKSEKKVAMTMGEEGNNVENKELGEDAVAKTAVSGKLGKRKVVKRVIRQKVAAKKDGLDNLTKQNDGLDDQTKQNENLEVKNVGEKSANPETTGQPDESSANASCVKTFTRKKVVKKVPVVKAVLKKNEGMDTEMKTDKEPDCSEDKPEVKSDLSNAAVVQDAAVKTTTKKKVVKRVPKRKVTGAEANEGVSDSKKDDDKDGKKVGQAGNEAKTLGDQTAAADSHVDDAKLEKKATRKMSESVTPVKQDDVGNSSKTGSKADKEDKTNEKRVDEKSGSVSKINNETGKQKPKDNHVSKREKSKEIEKSKDEEKKNKEGKDESKSKSNKDVKEKKQPEEPPRHPGLFLQTKASRGFKLRSLSLSLDSLLDYTAKDIEESTFELSLFAESLYEMLQYQMGSRLLTFLQKLRIKYVMKRNQRKRQREENAKENDKKSSTKRVKTDEATVAAKTTKTEAQDAPQHDDEKSVVKEENTSVDGVENVKEEDDDEDPEEDPEEDDDMPDANPQQDLWNEESAVEGKTDDADIKSEKETENAKDKEQETGDETSDNMPVSGSESKPVSGSESKENVENTDKKKETPPVVVDKELLQAFRFFDRNRVGYIRVEDMRLIIHNLGKFLSYRDVKELVQSALLESSTGRDDRILYNKLVRMADI